MRTIRVLLFALLCGGALAPPLAERAAAEQTLSECQCLDCLKLWRLAAQAEERLHHERWQKARRALQQDIDYYNSHAEHRDKLAAEGRSLFCELWSTFEDEVGVLRELEIPAAQRQIFANAKQCLGMPSGATDPVSCEIDSLSMALIELDAPCPQLHLSILAHELVHAQECKARGEPPTWLSAPGSSCDDAFKGKTPPPAEAMLRYAESFFLSEVKAYDTEARVEQLLAHELTQLCRPDDYSSRQTLDDKLAVEFLERARGYRVGGQ